MWMRADCDALPWREFGGPHVIEENERSHHAPAGKRQHAPDLEPAAQVLAPRLNHQLEHRSSFTYA
jgi:hypothetical protein